MTLAQALTLRAAQAALIMALLQAAPVFMSLLIRWGGTVLRQAMGW